MVRGCDRGCNGVLEVVLEGMRGCVRRYIKRHEREMCSTTDR